MNIGELKRLLQESDLPDDAPVLGCGSDNGYYQVQIEAYFAVARKDAPRRRCYAPVQFFGDEHLDPREEKIPALIIR